MAEWYFVENGAQAGPVSAAELQQKVASGQITPDTLVWKDGMADWVGLSAVLELQSPAPPAPSAAPTPLPPPAVSSGPVGTAQSTAQPAPADEPAAASFAPAGETPASVGYEIPADQVGRIRIGEALSTGWKTFTSNFLASSIIVLVFGVVMMVLAMLSLIPLLGIIIFAAAIGYLVVGLWRAALAFVDGSTPGVGILFPPGKYILMPAVASIIVALISFILLALVTFPVVGTAYISQLTATSPEAQQAAAQAIFASFLIVMPLTILVNLFMMLFIFWPALVADRDYPAIAAVFKSFRIALPSFISLLVILVVSYIALSIGALLLFVGIIPAAAFVMCTLGAAYRQIVPARYQAA